MCYFYLTYRKLIQADSGLPSSTHLHESMQRVAPDYCNLTCRPVPAVYGHLEPAKRYIGNFSAEKKNGGPSHLSILSIVPNSYPRGGDSRAVWHHAHTSSPSPACPESVALVSISFPSIYRRSLSLSLSLSISLSLCSVQRSACIPVCAVYACRSPQCSPRR
jgi:hypothetical protein